MNENIGKELEKYTYQFFLKEALKKVPEDIDSREGSIIYDALAPACYELAESMLNLKNVVLESFVQSASGIYLDLKAQEVGISRIEATKAIAKGRFLKQDGTPFELNVGDRFSTSGDNPVFFKIKEWLGSGYYLLECEINGVRGNQYLGTLLPISNYSEMLEATMTEITIPARNQETDDELRERVLKAQSSVAFGGNVSDYIRFTMAIDGVGAVQIYPVWDGGGTVRVVVLDNTFGIPSDDLVSKVQELIDPLSPEGRGIAPIGHKVTVAAPEKLVVDISFEVTLLTGFDIEMLRETIRDKIEMYFLSVRKEWDELQEDYSYITWLFRSQLVSTILTVQGVANVQNLTLNSVDADIKLQLDNLKQELPILGEVIVS